MFEFEENSLIHLDKRKNDDFDVQLGLAMSNSIKKIPGSQILSPQEIHIKIQEKIENFLENFSSNDRDNSILKQKCL